MKEAVKGCARTQGACANTGKTTKQEAQKGIPAKPSVVAWTGSARLWLRISPLNNDSPPLECEERIETLEDLSVDHVGVSLATGVGDVLGIASQHLKSGTQRCRIPVCLRPSGEISCSGSCKDSRSFCPSAARLISKLCRFSSAGGIQGCRHRRDPAGQHRSGDRLFPSRPAFCLAGHQWCGSPRTMAGARCPAWHCDGCRHRADPCFWIGDQVVLAGV